MEKLSIFKNISKEDINKMLKCFEAKTKIIKKGDIILNYIGNYGLIGIIEEGEASLFRYDDRGNKTLIEKLSKDSIFGERFYNFNTDEMVVEATKDTEVIFLNYSHLINNYKNNCPCHEKLIQNLIEILTNKIIISNEKAEILTKKTIRDKLLTYFQINSKRAMSKTFMIPYTYTDLADYLGIDRAAMQRELKNLKEDGLIKTKNRRITIYY